MQAKQTNKQINLKKSLVCDSFYFLSSCGWLTAVGFANRLVRLQINKFFFPHHRFFYFYFFSKTNGVRRGCFLFVLQDVELNPQHLTFCDCHQAGRCGSWEVLRAPRVALVLNVAAANLFSLLPSTLPPIRCHPAVSDVRQSGMLDAEEEHSSSRRQR